jgi:squalene-hopene/tetraprenyl-beta-curcumene cyclase
MKENKMPLLSPFPELKKNNLIKETTIDLLQKKWSNEISIKVKDSRKILTDRLPYVFIEAFPSLISTQSTQVESLAVAGQLFANSLVICDDLIDGVSVRNPKAARVIDLVAMQFEAYSLLYAIFPANAVFWDRFREYLGDYAKACSQEKSFTLGKRSWQEYDEALAIDINIGKTGVAKTTIAGLAELEQSDRLMKPLQESISYFYLANQMLDDLLDWKDDLRSSIPSLLLSRIVQESPHKYLGKELEFQIKDLTRQVYYDGHAHYVLNLALQFLDKAENLKIDLPNLSWWDITGKLRYRCQALIQDTDKIVSKNQQRIREQLKFDLTLPSSQSHWQQLAWDALSFTVKQWHLGFGEAQHVMKVFHDGKFHSGDVFQRGIIGDILCDANKFLYGSLQPIIEYEANYLINSHSIAGVGGWSYFPNLPELPPDADDLAQVMQVLLGSNRHTEVEKYCETPLKVLLEDCSYPDGSFETWIVPASNLTPEQERQVQFIKNAWGRGADNDVIANLLYALTLYDKNRFTDVIAQGITYLESQQQCDGSWLSTWYYGAYYGTYVCLRLLVATKPDSPAISKALNFLRSSQLDDGGWGLEKASDPLNTALSLLGLGLAQKCCHKLMDETIAEKALNYLHMNQLEDKGWSKCEFIRMDIGRATGEVKSILSYGSRTITTAFVLEASIVWDRLTSKEIAEKRLVNC